jgi:hypothetical protein
MEIATEELTGGITRVILAGSLDIAGAAAIDLRMNVIAGANRTVLVDLRQVSFIGSMGAKRISRAGSRHQKPGRNDGTLWSQSAGSAGAQGQSR